MKLVIEILTGTLFYVEVEDEATVGELKEEIAKQEKLPQDRMILVLGDKSSYLMDDDAASLAGIGVEEGSHLYLFFDPPIDILPKSPSTPQGSSLHQASPPKTPENQQSESS